MEKAGKTVTFLDPEQTVTIFFLKVKGCLAEKSNSLYCFLLLYTISFTIIYAISNSPVDMCIKHYKLLPFKNSPTLPEPMQTDCFFCPRN